MPRIEVVLENRWAYIVEATAKQELQLREYYSFFVSAARYDRRYKLYMRAKALAEREGKPDPHLGWDGKIRLYKQGGLPASLFRATRADLKRIGIRCRVSHKRPKLEALKSLGPVPQNKYRFQHECVTAMCAAIPDGGGIVLAATGSGKSKIAADAFLVIPYTCLFVVDTLQLLYQSQKELALWLHEKVGIVGDSEYDVQRVTVATIQTLSRHSKDKRFMKWYQSVRIMIVDELHEQMSRRNFSVLEKVDPIAVFGLTATLQMKQKAVRFKAWSFCGPVIYEFPIQKAAEQNVVSKGSVLQLLFPAELEYDPKDYLEQYRVEVIESELKISACRKITKWLTKMRERYVLMLAERIDHVTALSKHMPKPLYAIRGAVSHEERETARIQFEKGRVRLLIASRVFKKGMNIKRVDAMLDVAEGNSKNDALQKYGRGVRLHKEKDFLYYIDIGTNEGRFLKRARKRRKAFTEAGIAVKTVKVYSASEALIAVKKFVDGEAV